jgi:hypothetical protein
MRGQISKALPFKGKGLIDPAKAMRLGQPGERRTRLTSAPATGAPRGRLAAFVDKTDPRNRPVFEGGLVYVSVEGHHPRKAVLDTPDFLRITSRDGDGPQLTRTRWMLDSDGLIRAYSLRDKAISNGVLVASAILCAREGESIEVAADPFDLRLSGLKKVVA